MTVGVSYKSPESAWINYDDSVKLEGEEGRLFNVILDLRYCKV